jgi:hypothetical protein
VCDPLAIDNGVQLRAKRRAHTAGVYPRIIGRRVAKASSRASSPRRSGVARRFAPDLLSPPSGAFGLCSIAYHGLTPSLFYTGSPRFVPVERTIRWLTATVTSSFDPRKLVSWVKEIPLAKRDTTA